MNTISPSPKILQLRELLAAKFPSPITHAPARLVTGLPLLDVPLGGGLRKGGIVELVSERPSAGSASLLRGLLAQVAAEGLWTGLIDGADSFDPHALPPCALARLLWLRCRTASEALQSADLLLRDGNLPLVCLDLLGLPAAELRRVTGPNWYRLQRVLEPTAIAFLALTPFALIPCADLRLLLEARLSLATLDEDLPDLWPHLRLHLTRQRQFTVPAEAPLLAIA